MDEIWDCIVVGGGAAGLSAALVLGRARRRTLLVDAGRPSNAPAHGIGGLLGHDGRPPAELYAAGRSELATYPTVEVLAGEVVAGQRDEAGFVLELADGTRRVARTVLLATGMDYRYPELPGIAERWGRSVFHCPFCHGWEVRDQALGVLDRGPNGVHRAVLLTGWSDDVTLFTDGPGGLTDEESTSLAMAGVRVEARRVIGLRGPESGLEAIVFADGSEQPLHALLVPVTLHQRSTLAAQLGAAALPPGQLAADAIDVDSWLQTSVPGLGAAGDLSAAMPSVANAIAAGSNAAAAVVRRLTSQVTA
jgi:thioredoxin reductase